MPGNFWARTSLSLTYVVVQELNCKDSPLQDTQTERASKIGTERRTALKKLIQEKTLEHLKDIAKRRVKADLISKSNCMK